MEQKTPNVPRAPINLRIKFRSDTVEQFIERYAVDVSRGGIFIRTKEPLPVGTQLRLDFQFQNGGALMSGDGTVVWIRQFDPNRVSVPPGMGVRFDKLTPESQAVLEQLLAEKAKRERGAVPGSGAGGLAVRRPSSMFSALEPQVSVTDKPDPGNQSTPATPAATAPASAAPPSSSGDSGGTGVTGASATGATGPAASIFGKSAGARPSQRHTPADGSATFDDMNDEPTQIAGKFPAFFSSDDEPTRAVQLDRESGVPIDGGAERREDSLDAIFPVTSRPQPATGSSRSPSASPPDSDSHPSIAEPKAPAPDHQTQPAPAAPEPGSPPDAAGAGPSSTDVPKPPITQVAESRKATKRRSPAVLVAVTVIVLGATAIFISRFFGSQATETVSPASTPAGNAATVGPPAVPPAPAVAPEPVAPAAPPSVAAETPPPAANVPPPASGALPSSPQNELPAAIPPSGQAARPSADSTAPAPTAEQQLDTTGASASHKAAKRKPTRAREPTMAAAPPQEAKATPEPKTTQEARTIEPPPVVPDSPAAPESQPAATPSGDAETETHQIRITSRPAGADVSLDGQSVGKTPFSVGIADVSAPHFVAVRKDGFEPFEQMISASSAWSKTKAAKGKAVLQVLKINAKLKQIGGATEVKTEAGPPAATGDGTPKAEVNKPERPAPPPGERTPPGSPP